MDTDSEQKETRLRHPSSLSYGTARGFGEASGGNKGDNPESFFGLYHFVFGLFSPLTLILLCSN